MLHFYTKSNVSERYSACRDIAGRSMIYRKAATKSAMRTCCDNDCRRMFYKKEKIKVQ